MFSAGSDQEGVREGHEGIHCWRICHISVKS
jgi:hypothetical protein